MFKIVSNWKKIENLVIDFSEKAVSKNVKTDLDMFLKGHLNSSTKIVNWKKNQRTKNSQIIDISRKNNFVG